jgi:ABC-type polysaccharide/polyol phosphate export permease
VFSPILLGLVGFYSTGRSDGCNCVVFELWHPKVGFKPIFSYTAILPWTLFSGSIAAAIPSIVANMSLVTKIYFPREIIPLSANLARLTDFGIALIVFVGLMYWYRIPVKATILFVPLPFIQITFLPLSVYSSHQRF